MKRKIFCIAEHIERVLVRTWEYPHLLYSKLEESIVRLVWSLINFVRFKRWHWHPPIVNPRNPNVVYVAYYGDIELGGWPLDGLELAFHCLLWEVVAELTEMEEGDEDFYDLFNNKVIIKRVGSSRSQISSTRFDPRLLEYTDPESRLVAIIGAERVVGWKSLRGKKDFRKAALDSLLYQGVPAGEFNMILQLLRVYRNKDSVLSRYFNFAE